jgi:preprotein translocase subunit SecY
MAQPGATNPGSMLGGVARFSELRQRVLFLFGALIVYRIGTFIPVPGIDPMAFEAYFADQQGTILQVFNMFSGGALERLSIFSLGVLPYISASIVVQMATHILEPLKQLRKEGEAGRRKITQYTRYGTVLLASFQSVAAATALQNQNVVIAPGPGFVLTAAVTIVTGTMFLMWLGEQITERGIGTASR